MMNLLLTSDFPTTISDDVVAHIRAVACRRMGWVTAVAAIGRQHFPAAQSAFSRFGVRELEFCALDEDYRRFESLDGFDAVYLSGGDPLVFRDSLLRTGFADRLRAFVAASRLVVGASGGAMQLGANVSLFRLLSESVDDVVARRAAFAGLGVVEFELLPHLNRQDAAFLEKVRRYSESVENDIVALEDGAALAATDASVRVLGRGLRYSRGERRSLEETPRSQRTV